MSFKVVLRPLLTVSNLLGVGPFGYWKDGQLEPQPNSIRYSLTAVVVLCSLQALIFADLSGTTVNAESSVADLIDTYGFAFTCLGSFVCHILCEKQLLNLCNRVLYLNHKLTYSSFHLWMAVFLCLIYEVVFATMSIVVFPFDHSNFLFYVIETFTYVGLEINSFFIFLQFIFLTKGCERAFRDINHRLVALSTVLENSCRPTKLFYLLRRLSLRHTEISAASQNLNALFSFQNLLSILLIFMEVAYGTYNGVVNLFMDTFSSAICDMILWAGYFLIKLMITLNVCSMCTHEARRAVDILQTLTFAVDDVLLTNEVEIFSLRLLHDEQIFDALGFFPLDLTLMYSMIGAATGYLIILVQFRTSGATMLTSYNVTT